MLIPRLWRRQAEKRGYTDDAIAQTLRRVGQQSADAGQLAAAQFAANLLGRALAGASIEADGLTRAALPPQTMDMIGRSLVISGELFCDIRTQGGLRFVPAFFRDVRGGPEFWVYDLDVPAPGGTLALRRPADGLLHFRWATSPAAPWRGQGPLAAAQVSTDLAAALESKLQAEIAKVRPKYVMPVPFGDSELADFRTNLGGSDGGLFTSPSMASGWGSGSANAPKMQEYKPVRIGADPPRSLVDLVSPAAVGILTACGIQPGMLASQEGTASREAYRQFAHSVVEPIASTIAAELSAKLERVIRVLPSTYANADLQSRARAYKSLVDGKMAAPRAAALCGFGASA